MVALLQQCDFLDEHKQEVLKLLAPPDPKVKPIRHPWQDWHPAILDYFTKEEWDRMAKPTLEEAMSLTARRILALGGHHLSETCFSSLTSLLLYVCNMGQVARAQQEQGE